MALISLNTRITLALVAVVAPLFVWGGRQQADLDAARNDLKALEVRYTRERSEMRDDIREINRKLDTILERIPMRRSG